jgi:hypothetical protein
MKYKPALAESKYRKAQSIAFKPSASTSELMTAFELTQQAIILSPRSRYYIFQADNIGRYIRATESTGRLEDQIVNFARLSPEDESFSVLSENQKYDFYLKLGHGFAQARDLHVRADGHRSYLALAVDAYDEAIKIRPRVATAYQGKYLVQRKAGQEKGTFCFLG